MKNERDSISDWDLVKAIEQGDENAAACLYRRHVDRVHRICYRIVLDRSHVADCVQEVWCKVFRGLAQFQGEGSFPVWLNRVAANTAIDYYRRWKKSGRHLGLDDVTLETQLTTEPSDGRQLDQALMQERLQVALQEVGVNQRTALILRYLEGMSPAEIADILGCREGTVRTHIQRCLVALRAKLAAQSHR